VASQQPTTSDLLTTNDLDSESVSILHYNANKFCIPVSSLQPQQAAATAPPCLERLLLPMLRQPVSKIFLVLAVFAEVMMMGK
jgi:hypothetical protein